MPDPGAGFEYPPVEVSWLQRDVLLFANTIGATADELHFLYVRPLCPAASSPSTIPLTVPAGAPSQLCRLPHLSHHPS
jgi:hypothetical protein